MDPQWAKQMARIRDHGAEFVGNNGKFAVNPDILAARSEVFAKMLSGRWLENDGKIAMPYSVEALRAFYYFIKHGIIDNLDFPLSILLEIDDLAKQYMFSSLRETVLAKLITITKTFGGAHEIIRHCYEYGKKPNEQPNVVKAALETIGDHFIGTDDCFLDDCDCEGFAKNYDDIAMIILRHLYKTAMRTPACDGSPFREI